MINRLIVRVTDWINDYLLGCSSDVWTNDYLVDCSRDWINDYLVDFFEKLIDYLVDCSRD
jgi:hypothetical protein